MSDYKPLTVAEAAEAMADALTAYFNKRGAAHSERKGNEDIAAMADALSAYGFATNRALKANPYKEYRADGWPLCPKCGEDELWSPHYWNGEGARPPLSDYLSAGTRCYRCSWASPELDLMGAWGKPYLRRKEDS